MSNQTIMGRIKTLKNIGAVLFDMTRFYISSLVYGQTDEHIKTLIGRLGGRSPMYVKILQALAGASDLFSDNIQEFICEYSDNVPFSDEDVKLEELQYKLNQVAQKEPELVITNLSETPIHSGTVSLVYTATLNSKPVVVKVIRPNGKEAMIQALTEFRLLARLASFIPQLAIFRFDMIIKENYSTLMRQFSTYTELNNLLFYASVTKENESVKIPYAYSAFTLAFDDILVMERVSGIKVEDIVDSDKDEYGYLIAKQAVSSIMNGGLYHGDLHRGNILFRENEEGKKQICLLDFGIVGRLSEQDRLTISSFYMSLGLRRYEDAIDTIICSLTNKEVFDQLSEKEQESLTSQLETIASTCCETAVGFGPHEIGQINRILASHQLVLAPVFCKIELALAMNASVSKSLETENTNITTHIRRIIGETVDTSLFDV